MRKMRKKIAVVLCLVFAMTALLSVNAFAARDPWGGWPGYGGWNDQGNHGNQSSKTKVGFYIQIHGEQMDADGNVGSHDKNSFTGMLAQTTLNKNLSEDFSLSLGGSVTEDVILSYMKEVPNQNQVLSKVVTQYKNMDAYIRSSNGKVIPWSKMTTDYYKIQWYVLKCEDDFWHVDGVIIDLETDKEISIVVPEETAKRAACVEYDVASGTFTPGFMGVKANRPHSYHQGNNDNLIIDGFHDVWYTVLDEDTFSANNDVIPAQLIDAANAICTLAGARLSELPATLQRNFGRIDSQAYKQEYVERTGSGKTLYVTPFITELLAQKYNVDTDQYIWLAMGDSKGNISKVYVMDRAAANVDNLFDGE